MITTQLKVFTDELKAKGLRNDYIVNAVKEYLQTRALNYIYNDRRYNQNLIFTGGTCLRFCFGLPRLSEDLDFDYTTEPAIEQLSADLTDHFKGALRIKETAAVIKGRAQKIYLKFPVLKGLGLSYGGSDILYLKIEPSAAPQAPYQTEISAINKEGLYFFIKRYSEPDLMSGKIHAFLTRTFFKGKQNEIDFKGRDVFDLIWYISRKVQPAAPRLEALMTGSEYQGKTWLELLGAVSDRLKSLNPGHIKMDLEQFVEDNKILEGFLDNYLAVFEQYYRAQRGL